MTELQKAHSDASAELGKKPPNIWDALYFWTWHTVRWLLYLLLSIVYIPYAVGVHIVILALIFVTLPALYWRIPRKIHLYIYVVFIMCPGKFLWYNFWRYNRRRGKVWDYEMGQPTPVKVDARRRLSISEKAKSQLQSPLFSKLPPEIRLKIYEYVILGDSQSYLILGWPQKEPKKAKDIRLRAYPCAPLPTPRQVREDGPVSEHWTAYFNSLLKQTQKSQASIGIGMLQSCRQIYNESIQMYYTAPTFTFKDLHRPPFFLRTVLPHRLALIRSVHLIYDQASMVTKTNHVACSEARFTHAMGQCSFCNPIHWFNGIRKYMTGLKQIRVHILIRKDQRIPELGKTWIARMLDLQTGPEGLRNMQVDVTPSFLTKDPDRDLLLDEEEFLTKAQKFRDQLQQRLKKQVERYVASHQGDSGLSDHLNASPSALEVRAIRNDPQPDIEDLDDG